MAEMSTDDVTAGPRLFSIESLLLPLNPNQYGPVTGRLLLRTGIVLAGIYLLGAWLALTADSAAGVAAGLSMVFPGGGFLYTGDVLLFMLTLVGFALAILLWWALSAFFTIPLVWALGIAGTLWSAGGVTSPWAWAVPVILAGTAGLYGYLFLDSRRLHNRKVAAITPMNDYLRTAPEPIASTAPVNPSDLDREVLGFMYELALQPADQFDGFDWGEQFHGGTCLRYQLAFLGESLAAYAVNVVPNHLQVIEPAMAAMIERMTDQRVWKYWRLENFLARGSLDPDPIANDNVMLTGFYQSQISLYEAATGSTRFDVPGSLKFVWKDGRVFSYDHKSLSEAIVDNLKRSNLGLYSCEPTWVFTICNTQAAQGLVGYDAVHGTNYWQQVETRFRKGLTEEMMTADGAFRHIRTNAFGFSFNDGDGTGEYFTSGSHGWEDIAPDLARRGKVFALRGVSEKMAALESKIIDGVLDIQLPQTRERATYIESSLGGWTGIIGGARAVGNDLVADAATKAMWRDCATGDRFPDRPLQAGVQSIATSMWPQWARPLSLGAINARGYVPPRGPLLAEAPWPAVIVTRAVSPEGEALLLTIEPWREQLPTGRTLRFSALKPDTIYRLAGSGVELACTADRNGIASVELPVMTRLDLELVPDHA